MAKKQSNTMLYTGLAAMLGLFLFRKKSMQVVGIGSIKSKFFTITSETTIDDLKKQYYQLAKIHHPDTGGSNQAFKELNSEYEKLQSFILQNGSFTNEEKTNEQHISDIYRDIINAIITIPGINIEIIGTWIWISGNTYPVREQIKTAGFKFHRTKKMWFWYPGEYRKRNNHEMDIEEIRQKYGSEKIENKTAYTLNGINDLADNLLRLQTLLIRREKINIGV